MMRTLILKVTTILILFGVIPVAGQESDRTVWDLISSDEELSIFWEAVQIAGIENTLLDTEEFTVFVPKNADFLGVLEASNVSLDVFLNNAELLQKIIPYHFIPRRIELTGWTELDGGQLASITGEEIGIHFDGEQVLLNGFVRIVDQYDASNGSVYWIDNLLIPPPVNQPPAESVQARVRFMNLVEDFSDVDISLVGLDFMAQGIRNLTLSEWFSVEPGTYDVSVASSDGAIVQLNLESNRVYLDSGTSTTIAVVPPVEGEQFNILPIRAYEEAIPPENTIVTWLHVVQDVPEVNIWINGVISVIGLGYPYIFEDQDGLYTQELSSGSYNFTVSRFPYSEPLFLNARGVALKPGVQYLLVITGTEDDARLAIAESD